MPSARARARERRRSRAAATRPTDRLSFFRGRGGRGGERSSRSSPSRSSPPLAPAPPTDDKAGRALALRKRRPSRCGLLSQGTLSNRSWEACREERGTRRFNDGWPSAEKREGPAVSTMTASWRELERQRGSRREFWALTRQRAVCHVHATRARPRRRTTRSGALGRALKVPSAIFEKRRRLNSWERKASSRPEPHAGAAPRRPYYTPAPAEIRVDYVCRACASSATMSPPTPGARLVCCSTRSGGAAGCMRARDYEARAMGAQA